MASLDEKPFFSLQSPASIPTSRLPVAMASLEEKKPLFSLQSPASLPASRTPVAMASLEEKKPICEEEEDVIAWFDNQADKANLIQKQTLQRIINLNKDTEYLRSWFGDEFHAEELELEHLEALYRSILPVSSHSDFDPYLQRTINGDTSPILIKEPITAMAQSSGTTDGRKKYVPFTSFTIQSSLQNFKLGAALRSRVLPSNPGGKVLEFIYGKPRYKSGGVFTGSATTHFYESPEFYHKQKTTKSFTCTPKEVILSGDYKQTTYCHFLLGLLHRDSIELIGSSFVYNIFQAFAAMEELYLELCSDIEKGVVSEKRVSCPNIRNSMVNLVKPNPGLAKKLRLECEMLREAQWEGMVPSLWPNAKYIYSIMTGSMLHYVKKLRHYAGNVPLVGADYGASEGWIGVNVEPLNPPEKVTFTVVPSFAYFEFIPLKRKEAGEEGGAVGFRVSDDYVEEEPVRMSEVEVGREYEVVLTNFSGLYRYRLGDVVGVTGFYKNSPQLTILCRRHVSLSVNTDKTTEKDLQLAVDQASLLLPKGGSELVDFTSCAQDAHYVIYWEIKGEINEELLQECCSSMDLSFSECGYVNSRRAGSVGALELRIVQVGTFEEVLKLYIDKGGAVNQFKTPRCTRNQELIGMLDRRTRLFFRSTAYPS